MSFLSESESSEAFFESETLLSMFPHTISSSIQKNIGDAAFLNRVYVEN